jgi:hypothetical protein
MQAQNGSSSSPGHARLSLFVALLQVFGGAHLATFKLHVAAVHLADQARCQGPTALFFELWIERMVGLMKRHVKYRSHEFPERIFLTHLMLHVGMAECAKLYPEHCTLLNSEHARDRAVPSELYDSKDGDGVLLCGKGETVTGEELSSLLDLVAEQIAGDAMWYSTRGWPQLTAAQLQRLHVDGHITVVKHSSAHLHTRDLVTSDACTSSRVSDNRYVFIKYDLEEGGKMLCVARVTHFVSVMFVDLGGFNMWPPWVLDEFDSGVEEADVGVDGEPEDGAWNAEVPIQRLKLAVTTMWPCEIVEGVGTRNHFDDSTGEMPDMYCVKDNREDAAAVRAQRCWKPVLAALPEFQNQLVPTAVSGKTQIFLTANKSSGRRNKGL